MVYPISEQRRATSKLSNLIANNHENICIISKEQLITLYEDKVLNNPVSTARTMAGYASAALDLSVLTKVLRDLGVMGKVYEKVANGKTYIIFKGNPIIRTIFTGTRYLSTNAKVVDMAIGKAAVRNSVRAGARLTVYLTVPIVILEHLLKDQILLTELLADIAVTVVKVGISGILAAIAATAIGTVTTVAAAPLAVAIFVGILAGYALDKLDSKYGVTDKLIEVLKKIEDKTIGEVSRNILEIERILRWQILNGKSPGKGIFYP